MSEVDVYDEISCIISCKSNVEQMHWCKLNDFCSTLTNNIRITNFSILNIIDILYRTNWKLYLMKKVAQNKDNLGTFSTPNVTELLKNWEILVI